MSRDSPTKNPISWNLGKAIIVAKERKKPVFWLSWTGERFRVKIYSVSEPKSKGENRLERRAV
jgi:hypothetical protein